MKKKFNRRAFYVDVLRKPLRIMRWSLFLLIMSIFQAQAISGFGQKTEISLNLKNVTVASVLSKIEDNSNYYFMCNRALVDLDRTISIQADNKSVEEVLAEIFKGTDVKYVITGRQIVLTSGDSDSNAVEGIQSQQSKSVTGKITDTTGSPLPGVTVAIKGKATGTITDANGNFSLPNVPGDATLQFSFVGMKTQEVKVVGKTNINITMVEETVGIEEVVAIGYGTQKRIEMTSSISSVKSTDFIKGSVTDAAQLVKGKVAGLSIVTPDGDPNSTSQILLRGVLTLQSNTQPLIIIDGVPGSLTDVAADDIESMDILKDGSAAAIYGTRGTNGVILITTKQVKGETPATIEYNGYVTTQSITKRIEMMDAADWRELISKGKISATTDGGSSTNWLDKVIRKPSLSQTHNVSMKGGNANTNYIINVNYKALEGLILRSNNDMLNLRIEANHSMFNGKLKINGSLMGYNQKYDAGGDNAGYFNALTFNPTDPAKDADGNWTEHVVVGGAANPLALIYETNGVVNVTNFKPSGTITLLPFAGLTFKILASGDIYNKTAGYAESFRHTNSLVYGRKGFAKRETTRDVDDLIEITANYTKMFDKHNVSLLGGYGYQDRVHDYYWMSSYDFASDLYTYNNMSDGTQNSRQMDSEKNSSKLVSYFMRGNYNYNEKYMLMASIRYEGSSKFGADHKWGAFPAVSAGWNIINEPFMENLRTKVNVLKIRGGFGITGTAPTDPYNSLDRLSTGNKYLYNGVWTSVINPSNNANPDLRWEKKEETNVGLDFGVLNNRISGSLDLYKRTTKDLLWNYNVPKPPYLYSTILANAGTIENKGLEVQINATPVQITDLKWNTTVSYSTNRNKVISLSNDKFVQQSGYFYQGSAGSDIHSETTHRVKEGEPLGNFYGYKSIDIDDNGYWIIEGEDGNPKSISDKKPEDKRVLGNGLPKWYLSWNNTINYKHFDLNITMRGAFGYQILNQSKMLLSTPVFISTGNIMKCANNNIYGKRPLAVDQSHVWVSYYLEDGDYWKIDNITLGYTLDFKTGFVRNLRLYASGSNLFAITSYSGMDPEVNSLGLAPGVDDWQRYPSTRTYTLGLSVKF